MSVRSLNVFGHEVIAALHKKLRMVVRPVARDMVARFDEPKGPEDIAAGYPMVDDKYGDYHSAAVFCPFGVPGTRLRCREAYFIQGTHGQHRSDGLRWGSWSGLPTMVSPDGKLIAYYKEGFDRSSPMWRSPATMPSWASRITLVNETVGVCRLGDLTEDDVLACGVADPSLGTRGMSPMTVFRDKWNARYAAKGLGYDKSPWVWKVAVKGVEQ